MSYDYDKTAPPPPYPVYTNFPYVVPVVTPYVIQVAPNPAVVNDYLVWSLVNLICGWGIGSLIPLIFSILCRNNKNMNNDEGARTMSTLALIFNVIASVGGSIA